MLANSLQHWKLNPTLTGSRRLKELSQSTLNCKMRWSGVSCQIHQTPHNQTSEKPALPYTKIRDEQRVDRRRPLPMNANGTAVSRITQRQHGTSSTRWSKGSRDTTSYSISRTTKLKTAALLCQTARMQKNCKPAITRCSTDMPMLILSVLDAQEPHPMSPDLGVPPSDIAIQRAIASMKTISLLEFLGLPQTWWNPYHPQALTSSWVSYKPSGSTETLTLTQGTSPNCPTSIREKGTYRIQITGQGSASRRVPPKSWA